MAVLGAVAPAWVLPNEAQDRGRAGEVRVVSSASSRPKAEFLRGFSGQRNDVRVSQIFFSLLSQKVPVSFYWTVGFDRRRLIPRGLPIVAVLPRGLVCGVSRYGALGDAAAGWLKETPARGRYASRGISDSTVSS